MLPRRLITLRKFQTLAPGLVYNGFELRQKHYLEELDTTILRLKHLKTGANYVHLLRDDPNAVFAIGFRTVPKDSTGVAHILEHTVLCGSEKYPVRDPFFKMLNRSLATYMNAWTAGDHTLYPFSTENVSDHENLRDVYFDACFKPFLRDQDFRQEGWRLEKEADKLKLKGVVFNEMKGALSDGDSLFREELHKVLFKNSTYGFNSGGEPLEIPRLSHQDLINFHRKHYTPGNVLFLAYGNLLEDNLKFLDMKLADYPSGTSGVCPTVKHLTPIHDPLRLQVKGPFDPLGDPDKQVRTILSFRTNPIIKHQETFQMQLLGHLLLDGPSSPMHQALIESGLGSDYSSGTGYDTSTLISSFGIGVQGTSMDKLEKISDVVWETLLQCKEFSAERIDAALHQIELSLRYKSASFGLNMVGSVMSGWARNIYPVDQLSVSEKIAEFEKRRKRKTVFEPLIAKWLSGNQNRVEFTMVPCQEFNADLAKKEAALTDLLVSSLNQEEVFSLERENAELKVKQDSVEDVDKVLPILRISEICNDLKKPSLPIVNLHPIKLYQRQTPLSNGITYQRFLKLIPLSQLATLDIKLLPLATLMFTEYGVKDKSFQEFEEQVKSACGGLNVTLYIQSADTVGLMFTVHSLDPKRELSLKLFKEALVNTDYANNNRLRTQLASIAAGMSSAIASAGHRFALSAAASSLGNKFVLSDHWNGLVQARYMDELSAGKDLAKITDQIREIHKTLLACEGEWRASVTSTDLYDNTHFVKPFLDKRVVEARTVSMTCEYPQVIEMPINTSYAAAAFLLPPDLHVRRKAALLVISELLKSKYLHKEIREKGGAYGAGSSYNHLDNLFSFYSYRDPHPENSLLSFANSLKWIVSDDAVFTERNLDEAKLSLIGSMDAPVDLGSEGLSEFKMNISDSQRLEMRSAILQMTPSDACTISRELLSDVQLNSCIIKGA